MPTYELTACLLCGTSCRLAWHGDRVPDAPEGFLPPQTFGKEFYIVDGINEPVCLVCVHRAAGPRE